MKKLKKILPTRSAIHKYKLLKPISHLLSDPRIWHFNRRGVASGLAIGIFFGFLPIPFQMLLTAMVTIFIRANLGVGVVSTWVTNPISMPFIFWFNYYVGCLLLGMQPAWPEVTLSFESMVHLSGDVLVPLYFGSIINAIVFSLLSLFILRGLWRYNVVKLYNKKRKRCPKRTKKVKETSE